MFLVDLPNPAIRTLRVLDTIDSSMPGGHDEVDVRQIRVVHAIPEKARRLDGRMQTHFLGAGEYPARERELNHGFAPRNGEASPEAANRRREIAETAENIICRHVGAVFQMPGIGIVAVRAPQQAAGDEKHDAQARTVVTRRCLIGMAITERAFGIVLE